MIPPSRPAWRRLLLAAPLVLGPAFPAGTWPSRPAAHAAPPAPRPAAEEAIRAVLDAQVAAWNKGDLEGFMTGYWRSPDLTFFSAGNRTRGWQATLERYRKRYQAEGQEMGKLTFSELQVEVLGPDSAFVRGRWQLVRRKDRPGGLFTLIFRRFPEGWRIVHDHTSS
jgi:beta-aspartyl-peptidase (threonine type)